MQQNFPVVEPEVQQPEMESSTSNDGPSESTSSSSPPPRGTRPLNEVHERCYMAIVEPNNYEKAPKHPEWIDAIEEEMKMIQKNET